jgi:hypothetical protein
MSSCPKCGTENLPAGKFCHKCGTSLTATSQVNTHSPPTIKQASKRKAKAPQALEFSWDGRIRSARELFRLLHDFLIKYGYEHDYHELKDEAGAIEGTATFWDSLTGKKDSRKGNWWLLGNGILLMATAVIVAYRGYTAISETYEGILIGLILFFLGTIFMQKSTTVLRKSLSVHVEGETYRAKAERKGDTSLEVYDVVSNCRVVFSGKVGTPVPQVVQRGKPHTPKPITSDIAKLSKKMSDWDSLKSEFDSFTADFHSLRPRIEIPTVSDNKKE